MKRKVDQIRERLGYDPAEACSFRMMPGMPVHERPMMEQSLAAINASPYVKRQLTADDVYVHSFEAGSTRFMPSKFMHLSERTMRNVVEDAKAGFAFLVGHDDRGNPYGRTFDAELEQVDGATRAVVHLYMLRDHSPNGSSGANTNDIDKGITGGTIFDASLGFGRGGRMLCDVCGDGQTTIYDSACNHFPGSTTGMTEAEIARQTARGIPNGVATYTLDDAHAAEISVVFDGAIPGAGTALAAETETEPVKDTAHPREEEQQMKYSAELKATLGLDANATDEQVEAKLSSLKAAETRAAEAETKLFVEKYTGKLDADVIEELKSLPNRDAVAEKLAAKAAPAPVNPDPAAPKAPVGGLEGVSLAAAADKETKPKASPESEDWRKGMGVFESPEKLAAAALTSPTAALEAVLGTKFSVPRELREYDEQAIENRKATYGIA